jgi:hypothetical protein
MATEGQRLYEDALKWMEQRQIVLPDEYYGKMSDIQKLRAFSVAQITTLDELAAIHESLMTAIDTGQTMAQWKTGILNSPDTLEAAGLSKARLDNIFRTNVQHAYMMGITSQQETPKALKRRPFFQYDAINDSRTRVEHGAMDNFIARHDDPVWQRWTPICGYRCFLPGTMVRGDFQIGLKSFYSGPAVELITSSGKRLSVTANHPVLTRRGWMCAKDIQEGDDLLSDQFGINALLPGVVDNEQPPASVEEVFQSLASQALGICHSSSFEFHDDMQFRKGDVYVAGADSLLMDWVFPLGNEGVKNWELVGANAALCSSAFDAASLPIAFPVIHNSVLPENPAHVSKRCANGLGKGAFTNGGRGLVGVKDGFFQRIIRSTGNLPSAAKLSLNQFWAFLNFRPLQKLSFTSGSGFDPVVVQEPGQHATTYPKLCGQGLNALASQKSINDSLGIFRIPKADASFPSPQQLVSASFRYPSQAPVFQESTEQAITDPPLFEKLVSSLSGKVAADQVVGVRNFTFSGHVYDFQTKNGLILSDDIISHNCRCTRIAITEAEAVARGWTGQTPPVPAEPDPGFAVHPLANDGKGAITSAVEARAAKPGGFWNNPAIQSALIAIIISLL